MNKNNQELFDKWSNTGAEDSDPFWGLFKVKEEMNQAILDAVKYGFKQACELKDVELSTLRIYFTEHENLITTLKQDTCGLQKETVLAINQTASVLKEKNKEIEALKKEIERLEEYEFMYGELEK